MRRAQVPTDSFGRAVTGSCTATSLILRLDDLMGGSPHFLDTDSFRLGSDPGAFVTAVKPQPMARAKANESDGDAEGIG
jgi:hypothetical protein